MNTKFQRRLGRALHTRVTADGEVAAPTLRIGVWHRRAGAPGFLNPEKEKDYGTGNGNTDETGQGDRTA